MVIILGNERRMMALMFMGKVKIEDFLNEQEKAQNGTNGKQERWRTTK